MSFYLATLLVLAFACGPGVGVRPEQDAATHYNLGLGLQNRGQLDEAIVEYHKAIKLDPNYAIAHYNLGLALQDKGQADDAITEYRTAIKLDPNDAIAHYVLGLALQDKGQVNEAIVEYRKAIELEPKFASEATFHGNLAIALQDNGQLDEAIAEHRKSIELSPRVAAFYAILGEALYHNGQIDEAIAEYRKAIELDPRVAADHANLGFLFQDNGQFDEAVAEYRKAIELDPKLTFAKRKLEEVLRLQIDSQLDPVGHEQASQAEPASGAREGEHEAYEAVANQPGTVETRPFGELVTGLIEESSEAGKAAFLCAKNLGLELIAKGHDLDKLKVSPRERDHSVWLRGSDDGSKVWTVTTLLLEPLATSTCTIVQTPDGQQSLDKLEWTDLSERK